MSLATTRRKGFLHATDAAIASLILALYTLSTIMAPPAMDWQAPDLRNSGQDLLWAMGELNLLDQTMTSRNPGLLRGLVAVLNSDLDFKITARDFPPAVIKIGVVRSQSETKNFMTSEVDLTPTASNQLPPAEDGYYANGTMDSNYGGHTFIAYDGTFDGKKQLSHVIIDFDGDGVYQEYGEGPYHFRSQFVCGEPSDPSIYCDGDLYEVGPFQKPIADKFTIYPSRLSNQIEGKYTLNGIETIFNVDTLDIRYEPDIRNYDVIVVGAIGEDYLNNNNDTYYDYLDQSGSIIELQEITTIDPFHSQIGLWPVNYSIEAKGLDTDTYNLFYQVANESSVAHTQAKFFYGSPIYLDFYNKVQRLNGNLSNGWNVTSSMSSFNGTYYALEEDLGGTTGYFLLANQTSGSGYDTVYLSNSTNFTGSDSEYNQSHPLINASEFDNNFYLVNVTYLKTLRTWRLTINPDRPYHFKDYGKNELVSEQPFIHMPNYKYNVSGEDWEEDYGAMPLWPTLSTIDPEKKGVPDFNCGFDTHRYQDSFPSYLDEIDQIVITDVNASSLSENCDNQSEYVQFDFNADNKYNNSPKENIYQTNDTITINSKTYRIVTNDTYVKLIPVTPPAVETVVYAPNVRGHHGEYINFPMGSDPDDRALLRSMIATTASRKVPVTLPRSSSGTEVSVSYLGALEETSTREYLPYSLQTSWWFQ